VPAAPHWDVNGGRGPITKSAGVVPVRAIMRAMRPTRLQVAAFPLLILLSGPIAALRAQAPDAAQPPAVPAETAPEAAPEVSAPVVVDGVTLFHVVGVRIYPADGRARAIADRIAAIAADPSIDPASVKTVASADSTDIVTGSRIIARILENDARLEGLPRQYLADIAASHIRDAIVRHRADRRPTVLAWNSLVEAAWALGLGLGLWGTHRLLGRLRRRIERHFGTRVRDVQFQSVRLISAEQFWRLLAAVLRVAWVVGAVVVLLVYLRFALARFPWTRGLGLSLAQLLLRPLHILGNGLLAAAPDLIFLAVLALVTRYLLKLVAIVFDGIAEGRVVFTGFDAEWAQPTYRIVRFLVIALAVVVAYPYIPGSSSDAFKGVSLFIGVVFSLGSSSIMGNTLAGLSMIYRRAFRVGDIVKIGSDVGEVEKIRTLVTHLRTFKNEEVIVPNSVILGTQVVNYTAHAANGQLLLHTTVGIGYETPWRQVEAMLLEAAGRVTELPKVPPPFVLKLALGDFCVTYELNVYCDQPGPLPGLYSALHQNILDVFNEYGVQIMTPAYIADPAQPKIVPRSDWYASPARTPGGGAGPGTAGG
jgi:small-conductance mechanosensitive channel